MHFTPSPKSCYYIPQILAKQAWSGGDVEADENVVFLA